jgi:hypothetical protein
MHARRGAFYLLHFTRAANRHSRLSTAEELSGGKWLIVSTGRNRLFRCLSAGQHILPSRVLTPSLMSLASLLSGSKVRCRRSSMCLHMFFGLLHTARATGAEIGDQILMAGVVIVAVTFV